MGDGHPITIHVVGTDTLYSTHNPSHKFKLKNLLLVPNLKRNLISVGQFTHDNNVYFEFHPSVCLVKPHGSSQVLLKGYRGKDGLYFLPTLTAESQVPAATSLSADVSVSASPVSHIPPTNSITSTINDYIVWHHRLGHANSRAIHTVLSLCKSPISSNNNSLELCKSCSVGKAHRIHSPPSTTQHHIELIHTDLWGPSPSPSSCGYL